jgi:UDP-N-acetylglucosamine:LPS N-acetylglucosamine transferase
MTDTRPALAGREPCRRPCAAATGRTRSSVTRCSPALASADLVVGRAGSSTLAEVSAMGLPMVVVPYRTPAGHQRANAASLVEAGAAALIADEDFDARGAPRCGRLLEDPQSHAAMSAAARAWSARGRRRGRRARACRRHPPALPGTGEIERVARGGQR